jgi:orotate phosphoribosyltransferase
MAGVALVPQRRGRLAQLVRDGGYERREQPFRLSSGATSHDYVDVRRAVANGAALRTVAEAMIDEVGSDWDLIGGPTMGADPLAHAVALLADKSWFSVRKEPKGHGRGQWIEGGDLVPGDRVLAVEDTVSTGGSLLGAIERIVGTGATVVAATVVLDRSPAVAPRFEAAGIPWLPLLTWEDLGIEPLSG